MSPNDTQPAGRGEIRGSAHGSNYYSTRLIGTIPVDTGTSLDNGPYIAVFVALTLLAGHSIFSVMTEQYFDAVGEREQQLFERLVREQQEVKYKELMDA